MWYCSGPFIHNYRIRSLKVSSVSLVLNVCGYALCCAIRRLISLRKILTETIPEN